MKVKCGSHTLWMLSFITNVFVFVHKHMPEQRFVEKEVEKPPCMCFQEEALYVFPKECSNVATQHHRLYGPWWSAEEKN